jgi:hypothetical protein
MTTEPQRNARGTGQKRWTGALLLVLGACGQAVGGEHGRPDPGRPPHVLRRLAPAGGWNPGGGLLHWWNPHCFPRYGGPDDYCRKPPPKVCWPPYPPYYVWGPPEVGPSRAR